MIFTISMRSACKKKVSVGWVLGGTLYHTGRRCEISMRTLGSKRITLKKKKINPSLWGRKWRILNFPTLSKPSMFQDASELISSLGATPTLRVNVTLAAEAVNKSRRVQQEASAFFSSSSFHWHLLANPPNHSSITT